MRKGKNMKEFYINDDGVRIHAKLQKPENAEKCPLVIIVHGFTGHMEERHILAVSDAVNEIGFASLRVEMYGHGKSDGRFEDHTLLKWINNINAVIDYARTLDFVTDLYLCGHSQGGLLTVLAGGMRNNQLKGIIPMSPAVMIPEGARKGNILGIPFDPNDIPDVMTAGPLTLKGGYIRAAQLIHVEDEVTRFHGPVLLIHGTKDEAVPYQCSVELNEQYENSRLVTIPDDNHGYALHLDMVIKAVKEFLLELNNK